MLKYYDQLRYNKHQPKTQCDGSFSYNGDSTQPGIPARCKTSFWRREIKIQQELGTQNFYPLAVIPGLS